MKKNILLLGLILIFTGCSCDYNLDMSGDKINEELNLPEYGWILTTLNFIYNG